MIRCALIHDWLTGMRAKLGLTSDEAGDKELVQSLLSWMQKSRADFTNTFRDLSAEPLSTEERYQDPEFREWHSQWELRLDRDNRPRSLVQSAMNSVNPAVIANAPPRSSSPRGPSLRSSANVR